MVVTINMSIPESCASCPLSVRLFGKLYCPAMNDRVGNEGKDSRCPLVDAEGRGDLISRQSLCDALDKAFADRIKMFDYDSYEKADEKTQLVCDGIMRAIDVVLGQPTVDHFADASKKGDMISRADAVDAISKIKRTDNWQAAVSMALLDLPSAQPEIIRCKDCKHYQFADNRAFGMPVKMCEWFGFEDVDDDDFCSLAERRTDE